MSCSRDTQQGFFFCWGITNPPVLIGRTFFDGGLQIRRDAWRDYSLMKIPCNPCNPCLKKEGVSWTFDTPSFVLSQSLFESFADSSDEAS